MEQIQDFENQALAIQLFFFLLEIAVLLLIRPVVLWYFKVPEQMDVQSKTLDELRRMRIEMQEQTRIQKEIIAHARGEIIETHEKKETTIKAER